MAKDDCDSQELGRVEALKRRGAELQTKPTGRPLHRSVEVQRQLIQGLAYGRRQPWFYQRLVVYSYIGLSEGAYSAGRSLPADGRLRSNSGADTLPRTARRTARADSNVPTTVDGRGLPGWRSV